jgi:amidase
MDRDLCLATLTEVAEKLRRREISPTELLRVQLEQIAALDPTLHAYVTVTEESATAAARVAESEITAGNYRGPLHGVPVAVKDLCFTRGIRTTCGSNVLADFVPDHDAHVVERLARAGAVPVGKLALTEFAMMGYAPGTAPPVNPWDETMYAGMSSSGSAVAASAGLAYAAIGTDTGGSIRFPAAACGVVGLKPTYGRVSRAGVFPLAASLDHVGPLTRSVADAAAVLDAIAGHDPADPTTLRSAAPACAASLESGARGVRIGLDEVYGTTMTQPRVADALHRAVRELERLGAVIVPVSVPPVEGVLPAWPVLCAAEAVVGHASLFPSRSGSYGLLFRTMLEWGVRLSGGDVAKASLARAEWVGRFEGVFEDIDVLVCPPACATTLPAALVAIESPFAPDFAPFMRFTAPTDFSGHPTLTIPFGAGAPPDSVQLVARRCGEALLCQVGFAFERAMGRPGRPTLA